MTERLFSITKNLFKTYKCPERIKTKFKPLKDRFGQFLIYSAAFYNWDDQGVSENEIKKTIQEFIDTSKVFFDQRNKTLNDGIKLDCPVKRSTLSKSNRNEFLTGEWEAIIVQEHYQVRENILDL